MPPRVRLVLAAVLFLGWMTWLGYAALVKSRGPVISTAQAAATAFPVVAELSAGPDGKPVAAVKVVESLKQGWPAVGTELHVVNLAEAHGFDGPGQYLLLLAAEPGGLPAAKDAGGRSSVVVVGHQRSPGYDLAGTGKPTIYPWTHDVKVQAAKLFK